MKISCRYSKYTLKHLSNLKKKIYSWYTYIYIFIYLLNHIVHSKYLISVVIFDDLPSQWLHGCFRKINRPRQTSSKHANHRGQKSYEQRGMRPNGSFFVYPSVYYIIYIYICDINRSYTYYVYIYIYIYDLYIPHPLINKDTPRHLPSVLFPSPGLSLPLASCWDCPPRGTSSPPAAAAAGESTVSNGERSAEPYHWICKGT